MATSFTYTENKDVDFNAAENILYMLGGDDEVSGVNPDFVEIYGGEGIDDLSYGMISEEIPLNGTVTIYGGLGDDQLDDGAGVGTSYLHGDEGNDILDSDRSTGQSFLYGGAGNDELWGTDGDALIDKDASTSASSDSFLYGGKGNDKLNSLSNSDKLYGGGGKDKFIFGKEVDNGDVRDFSQVDTIDVSQIDSKTKKKGNQGFEFIGNEAFGKKAGELKFGKDMLKADTNGDGRADLVIEVKGENVTANDLNL